jgi:hypothetical protein
MPYTDPLGIFPPVPTFAELKTLTPEMQQTIGMVAIFGLGPGPPGAIKRP